MDLDVILFALKKGISLVLIPSGIIFVCLFLGFFIWPLKRRRNLARTLFVIAFFVYGLAGTGPVANFLIGGLESSVQSDNTTIFENNIETVVMLCGGAVYAENMPIADCLTPNTRLRLLKVRELCHDQSNIKRLLIVGGCKRLVDCQFPEAEMAYLWIREIGLPEYIQVSLEKSSRDTEENLKAVSKIIGQTPFYLVTSAAHMPRVLLMAENMNLQVRPVPCDFQWSQYHWTPWDLWPSPRNLRKADFAFHEYIGIIWFYFKDFFDDINLI
jgi:uncharacterized SAM-binding protein YcdF (DUF218 family)